MTVVLVLAVEVQLPSRAATEDPIQVPGPEVIVELVMAMAILGDSGEGGPDPCGIGPPETRRPTAVRSVAGNSRRTVGGRVTVASDGTKTQRFVRPVPAS